MKLKFVIEYDNTSLRKSNRIRSVLPKAYLKIHTETSLS